MHLPWLVKAWTEEDHPRDDTGKFVDAHEMVAAKKNPEKADELRSRVTNPDERRKLEAAISPKKNAGKKQGIKLAESKAREAQQKWRDAVKSGDEAEAKQQKYATYFYHLAAKHIDDGNPDKAKIAMNLANDFATGKRKPKAKGWQWEAWTCP